MSVTRRHLPRASAGTLFLIGAALVNRAANFLLGQGHDDALDLPPVAKAQDIALVAAVFGASGRFEPGIVAIGFDKQRGIRQCLASCNERHVHPLDIKSALLAFRSTDAVNTSVTILASRLPLGARRGMSYAMNHRRTSASGGIFLFLGPVLGALYGLGRGQPIQWMIAGFGIGLVIAVAFWLFDRRKG